MTIFLHQLSALQLQPPNRSRHLPIRSAPTHHNPTPTHVAVRQVPPSEASSLMSSEGYRLLDIRPAWEWEKARVEGSTHVPLFVEDSDTSLLTWVKKSVHLGYIGLWTGQLLTTVNEGFLGEVERAFPDKEDKLLVACGEGLRSRIAISKLQKHGYKNLGWLAGGFNRASNGDFGNVKGSTQLHYATIGGVSYIFLHLLLKLKVIGKGNEA